MPLVYQQNINLTTKLGVWHIREEEDFFSGKLNNQNQVRHPQKRLQHLAGRYLLKELYPQFPLLEILISDTLKPFIPDESFHFSISHCRDYAAAIVSTDSRVGADIEIIQTKINRIKDKFLTTYEQELLYALPLPMENALTLSWSIKEAVYKWYGSGKVDFKGHIHIVTIVYADGMYKAAIIFTREESIQIVVHGLFLNNYCVTWVTS